MTRDEAVIKVNKIIEDITDRKGIGNEYEMIDKETQSEIKKAWISILLE